ncbi:hypothetical protein GLU60_00605 [Nanohaloarchaea archaeon H01]|nr:hypothetical protein [Nanohaloarchaea archaeon H01]
MRENINCDIPKTLKTRLKRQSEEEMTSQASIIRQSIDEYCEEIEE